MDKTAQKHLDAITSGNVTSTNVIGVRKILNHVARIERGWPGNRCNASPADADAILAAIHHHAPIVRGDLHASGVRLVTNKRYARQLTNVADKIAALQGFRLVDYIAPGKGYHCYPVYQAWGNAGSFTFYCVPWQSGGNGPEILDSRG